VNANLRERLKAAERAEELVAEEVERTMARLKVADVTPTIVGCRSNSSRFATGEIEKARRKYGPFTPSRSRHRGADARHHDKIAHGPISEIRSHAATRGAHVIAAIRKAFHLQD